MLPATHTGIFSGDELEKERREYIAELGEQDGQAMFEQEYLCSFQAAIIGAYYGRQMQDADQAGRIRDLPWEPDHTPGFRMNDEPAPRSRVRS